MKFPNKGFFSKCDQIRSFLRIWSHLLKKSLMENFTFCAVYFLLNWNNCRINSFPMDMVLDADPTHMTSKACSLLCHKHSYRISSDKCWTSNKPRFNERFTLSNSNQKKCYSLINTSSNTYSLINTHL